MCQPQIYIYIYIYINQRATKELLYLQLAEYFRYPKETEYIIKLIQHATSSDPADNDLILNFFAGSGTTGNTVMRLNAEDGGNRRYILVQLDEAIRNKKNSGPPHLLHRKRIRAPHLQHMYRTTQPYRRQTTTGTTTTQRQKRTIHHA